jgi:hypothetical protein
MKFLTLIEFIHLFNDSPVNTFSKFLKQGQVKIGKNLKPLLQYIEEKEIAIEDIQLLFEKIKDRNEYLTRFYNTSLDFSKDNLKITDVPMKSGKMNNNQLTQYKNVIRNMHYKDILQKTKSGIENNPTYLDVLADLYLRGIVDYKILTPSAIHYMKEGRLGSVFSSYFFRASIMNPYLVYSLNHSVLKGTKIFTPTLGWGSYCYGFLESPLVSEYVGTDVIPSVCKKTLQFAKMFYPTKSTTIFCEPSEDLYQTKAFLNKYREHFDVVFFSPPYFKLELYSSKNQSTTRYKTYDEWLVGYWEQTIQLCHHVLIKGGKLCYILSGYGSQNTNESYDLLTDMNNITKKYFGTPKIQPMFNKDVHVTKHKETAEKIIVFMK